MIHIGSPYLTEDERYTYLKAKVQISDDTAADYRSLGKTLKKTHWRFYEDYPPKAWDTEDGGELYIAVPKKYRKSLCASRSDAFVVAMLWYAMMAHSDIEFEAPMSERLYFGISQLLIPAVCKKVAPIRLIGPHTNEMLLSSGAVGTGMSCGIDSLYSLKKYTDTNVPEHFRLTHLTYFNMGAIFHPNRASKKVYPLSEFNETIDRMSLEKMSNAEAVAQKHNLELVYVFSNLDRDYYRGGYGYTGVYRNCAMALALQGLFSVYYCSSAGWPEFFDLSLEEGSEHYETLLCTAFSNENLQFIISDYATRLEKTQALASYETAKQYLDVCFNFNNCGTCSKCYRTLITLDALNAIDEFSHVFNIDAYKKNRPAAFAWLLETMHGDPKDDNTVFAIDLFRFVQSTGMQIPRHSYHIYRRKKMRRKCRAIKKTVNQGLKRIFSSREKNN